MMHDAMPADMYRRMEHMRRAEMEHDAAVWRLLNEGRQRRTWFVRSGCWFLCQAGRQLVTLGRTLQHVGGYYGNVVRT